MMNFGVELGTIELRSPLIAAAGTVGSVHDFADVDAFRVYGAAVAKSVSHEPWPGRSAPRMAPVGPGMLNSIGIQNPGIDEWRSGMPELSSLPVPVWGSAVGADPGEFALVAKGLSAAGVRAVEVNLSCPNLEEGTMFALNPTAAASVVGAVRAATDLPIGAKLSPNSEDIVAVARAVVAAGADFVVLANTVWGLGIDLDTRQPKISGIVGGYSGPPVKPIALRCVWEVAAALDVPIVGCGGIRSGEDVIEYFLAGASAVELGSIHFAEPRAGKRILREIDDWCRRQGIVSLGDLTGGAHG
ncbi:MAG: dihydroorotate dehydrogenase [Acidimicrobiia bacterium]|nr:dihydroorotate dehydrogenase [Acidimicrobiia bacterium]NNJ47314.1 dihydroorotate dehydrogenase [Acidimicrobiia bacterium]RZV47021.1 MAG: dihydroorotate dehydrogenase [Acidimicrobiia bacterium]